MQKKQHYARHESLAWLRRRWKNIRNELLCTVISYICISPLSDQLCVCVYSPCGDVAELRIHYRFMSISIALDCISRSIFFLSLFLQHFYDWDRKRKKNVCKIIFSSSLWLFCGAALSHMCSLNCTVHTHSIVMIHDLLLHC